MKMKNIYVLLPVKIRHCLFLISALFLLLIPNAYAQRGCCSHHGGVASCDSSVGELVCQDGSYSPTCTCPIAHQKKNHENNHDNPQAPNPIDN